MKAYDCKCGWKDFDAGICPVCGTPLVEYEAGAPPAEDGCPNVIPDNLTPHWDYAAGQMISSRSERKRVYEEKGLIAKSYAEHRRKYGGTTSLPGEKSYSFPGQKDHRSSAEIAGVRTKTGQRVI